ncbi:MAG: multi-sensor hybrid histidine kinase [Bacteroidetes bacterium]|nr:MAG: multi-sensor hybrid histidine kinase [Bacteroidota bacterium]
MERDEQIRQEAIDAYKAQLKERLQKLLPVFAKASIGDFSDDIEVPDEDEDEFGDLFAGIQIMQEVIREKIQQLEELNAGLEEKINEKVSAFEEAQALAHVGNWKWKLDSEKIEWSNELFRIFGLQPMAPEIAFDTYLGYIHPEDLDNVQGHILSALKTRQPYCFNHRIVRNSGAVRYLQCRGFVHADKRGEPVFLHGTVQDITELRHSEQALQEMNDRLEASVALRTLRLRQLVVQLKHEAGERKKAEASVIELARIVESSEDAIIGKTLDGLITSWNKGAETIYGFKAEEVTGKHISIIYPEDKQEEIDDILYKVSADRQVKHFETVRKRKDGSLLYMMLTVSPIKNAKGEIIGASSIAKDISLRKKYETELNSLARFTEENPNPVMRFSIEKKKLVYANRAGRELTGLLVLPDSGREIHPRWLSLFRKTNDMNEVTWHEFNTGDHIYMCTLIPDKAADSINIYAVDVTAIRQAETEIKRLSMVIGKTTNAVLIADCEGNIEWVNEGFEQISGYTLADVKGTSGSILRKGKPTGLNISNTFFKRMLREQKPVSYESRNYKKDGTEYWTLSTLTPILNDKEEVESIVVIDSDITTRKKAELEIIRAKKIAEDSAKTKELFLANMSHEIRTPMNAIMGIVQLMQDSALDSKQREYMRTITFAGESLMRIINDVLDLAKVESGKISIEKIDFNIFQMIDDLSASMSYRAREKNIRMETIIDSSIPSRLCGDPVRLNQVLMNLLSNAIKFTEKGYVKLEVTLIGQKDGAAKIAFEVEDTGIGIPEALHRQIFEAFEQGHNDSSHRYGGTGLGLSIVKRFVGLLDGTIALRSKPGQGACFTVTFTFPVAAEQVPGSRPEIPPDALLQLQGKHVLLVEDNTLNQMVAAQFLQQAGLDVTISNNGVEAIEALLANDYDIVLMDIQMPEMNGYDATKYIRNTLSGRKGLIPILAMTAHAIRGEEDKCIAAGMNAYISKPLSKAVLLNKIAQLVSEQPGKLESHDLSGTIEKRP